jgi:hypothetical protein
VSKKTKKARKSKKPKKSKKLSKADSAKLAVLGASNAQVAKECKALREWNRKLRARVIADNRLREAKRMLAEAEVPAGILSTSDLVQFEPHQWAYQIKLARRIVRMQEAEKAEKNAGAPKPELKPDTKPARSPYGVSIYLDVEKEWLTPMLAALAPESVADLVGRQTDSMFVGVAAGRVTKDQLAAICSAIRPLKAEVVREAFQVLSPATNFMSVELGK